MICLVCSWSHQNMASFNRVELGTSLYQWFVLWFFEDSMHVNSKRSENKTHLKSLFMYIHKCAMYIKDINWSLNPSSNIRGFYRTESNWLPLLLSESHWLIFWVNLGTSNWLSYWVNLTYLFFSVCVTVGLRFQRLESPVTCVIEWISRGHFCLALCSFWPAVKREQTILVFWLPSRALMGITWRGEG